MAEFWTLGHIRPTKLMPNYFCETCNKILARNEQRRNYESTTAFSPVIMAQMNNLPNHPMIGGILPQTKSNLIVRCVHCGSDTLMVPTEEEQKQLNEIEKERHERNRWIWAIMILMSLGAFGATWYGIGDGGGFIVGLLFGGT